MASDYTSGITAVFYGWKGSWQAKKRDKVGTLW